VKDHEQDSTVQQGVQIGLEEERTEASGQRTRETPGEDAAKPNVLEGGVVTFFGGGKRSTSGKLAKWEMRG